MRLYRAVLREVRQFAVAPLQRKLRYNARQIWSFFDGVRDPETLQSLHEEARAAVRVLRWLKALPKVRA